MGGSETDDDDDEVLGVQHGPGPMPVVAARKVDTELSSARFVTLFAAVVSDCAVAKLPEFRMEDIVRVAIDKTMKLTTTSIISAKIKTAPPSSDRQDFRRPNICSELLILVVNKERYVGVTIGVTCSAS